MTDQLTFLSWSRRGAGALPGPVAPADGRRQVGPAVKIDRREGEAAYPGPVLQTTPISVLGAGDCESIQPARIVRRSPVPGDLRHEPNYLVTIEFDHADMPWLFGDALTGPEAAHLNPWLMLVVVRTGGSGAQGAIEPGHLGPVLHVFDAAALPSPEQAWAFAHIQVHTGSGDAAGTAVRETPEDMSVRSRILCPTRLAPNCAYTAVLVPTFVVGQRAGVFENHAAAANGPYWQAADDMYLPAYDSWTFSTGPAGDFETLARKLHTAKNVPGLGERRVAVEARAALMQEDSDDADDPPPLFPPGVEAVPTAIARISSVAAGPFAPDAEPGVRSPKAEALQARLKELIDLVAAASGEEPVVGPPLYGQWPADRRALDLPGHDDWVTQLNADPYQRIAAGVGTRIVAHDQEALMADAWRQLADLEAANRRIRHAALMAAALQPLHVKLAAAPHDVQVRVSAGTFGRIPATAARTVRAQLDVTTVPGEVLGPAMVRVAAVARRAAVASSTVSQLARANASPAAVAGAVVRAFTEGSAAVVPLRLTAPVAVDFSAVRQALGANVFAAAGANGRTLSGDVAELDKIEGISEKIAARFNEPRDTDVVPAGVDVVVRVNPKVSAQIAKAKWAQKIPFDAFKPQIEVKLPGPAVGFGEFAHEPVNQVFDKPINPGVFKVNKAADPHPGFGKAFDKIKDIHAVPEFNEQAKDHGPEPVAAPMELTISTRELLALKLFGQAEDGPGELNPRALSLQSDDVRLTLGQALRAAPNTLLGVVVPDHARASALGVAEAMRASVLAELDIDRSSVLTKLGALSATDAAAYKAAVDARVAAPTPALRQPLPEFARFDQATTAAVLPALLPRSAYGELVGYAHTIVSDAVIAVGRIAFPSLRAAPTFRQPLFERLAALDKDWLLGGVGKLPPNSVCLFGINTRFVESLLAGANHEMTRELVWRGYPTDLRGTSFRRFWDLPGTEVKPMTRWGVLGRNHSGATDPNEVTVVVIKGDLMRRYPTTIVSAVKGSTTDDPAGFVVSESAPELDHGSVDLDVTFSILDIAPQRLREVSAAGERWYISLLENTHDARFGLDDQPHDRANTNAAKAKPSDWSWQGLRNPRVGHLTAEDLDDATTSAQAGARLFQQPFRALLPATDYLMEDPQ